MWRIESQLSFFLPPFIRRFIHCLLAVFSFARFLTSFFGAQTKELKIVEESNKKEQTQEGFVVAAVHKRARGNVQRPTSMPGFWKRNAKEGGITSTRPRNQSKKKHTYTCIIDISFISALFLAFVLWHFVYVFLFAASHFILPVKIILVALYPFFTRSRSRPLLPLLLLLLLVLRCEPKLIRISFAPINTCRFSLVLSLPLYRLFFHVWGQCWAQFFMRFIFMPFQSPLCV